MIKVQDDSDSLREEMKRPYISAEVMEYLRKNFDSSYLLAKDVGSESMRLGKRQLKHLRKRGCLNPMH